MYSPTWIMDWVLKPRRTVYCAVRTGCLAVIQATVRLCLLSSVQSQFVISVSVAIAISSLLTCIILHLTELWPCQPPDTSALFFSLSWRTKPAALLFPVSLSFLLHSQLTRHSLQLYNPTQLPFLELISALQSDVSLLQSAISPAYPRQCTQLNLHISSKIKSKCINFEWQHHIHEILMHDVLLLCVLVVVVVTDRSRQCQIKMSVKRFVQSVLCNLSVEEVSKTYR